jgi:hypothetical protein
MSKHDVNGHGPQGGYEKTDAQAGPTYRAGLTILGAMFLTALVLVPMYRFLGRREAREQRPAASVLRPDAAAPSAAFPKLVTSEPAALAEFRAQEDAFLAGWGWVEKDKGIARMPIDAAMKIVAERGLPTFPAPEPAPAGGAR